MKKTFLILFAIIAFFAIAGIICGAWHHIFTLCVAVLLFCVTYTKWDTYDKKMQKEITEYMKKDESRSGIDNT